MKGGWLLLLGALGLGLIAGEQLTISFAFRRSLGNFVRRDNLRALVERRGIYERDLARHSESLETAIDRVRVSLAAARQPVAAGTLERELEGLRGQSGNEKAWHQVLERAGTSERALRREVAEHLRDRAWLDAQIATSLRPNDEDVRRFFAAHPEQFALPLRFRASHLFLAAPEGYPNEVIESKRTLASVLAARLQNGESFPNLVAQYSEDAESRKREGDLNYFAEERMLPAIWNAAQTLREGQLSTPIRSRLGFHLLRLTRRLPAAPLPFPSVAPEISALLENQKRPAAVAAVVGRLGGKIQFATGAK